MPITYRALIRPIPPDPNISDIASYPASTLCANCAVLRPARGAANRGIIRTPYARIVTYPSFPELKESAQVGCGLCRLLRKVIRAQWNGRPMEESGIGVLNEKDGLWDDLFTQAWDGRVKITGSYFTLVPFVCEAKGTDQQMGGMVTRLLVEIGPAEVPVGEDGEDLYGEIRKSVSFKVWDSVDLDASDPNARRRLPCRNTVSDENLNLIQQWVGDCKTNHRQCASSQMQGPWLPTRLLKIELDDDAPRSVNLVETAILNPDKRSVRYIALSHMWGDVTVSPPFRTTKANYIAVLEDIDGRVLPPNFVQAVRVCARLGIQYLWIDSLCIIQDDSNDWEREAGLMHLVYKHAELTVVATSAKSSHDGFLSRDIYSIPAVKVGYEIGDNSDRYMILAPEDDVETGLRSGDVDRASWNTRGWTMQERSLSTRLVHFCRNKLYFECRACLKSEEGEPESIQPFSSFRMWPQPPSRNELSNPNQIIALTEDLFDRWRKSVVEYSFRNLTHGSDKLRAIQSLAAEMASSLLILSTRSSPDTLEDSEEEYISFAGMWRQNLYRELLWYVERGTRVRPPAHDKRNVPSWSWASLDVRVGFVIGSRTLPKRKQQEDETLAGDNVKFGPNWEEKNFFRVVGLGEKHSDVEASNYIEIETLSRRFTRILYSGDDADSYLDRVDRLTFPYDLLMESGNTATPTVFAHALLDLDNRDNLLWDTKPLMYVHVNNEQFPSGIVLQQKDGGTGGSAAAEMWTRVGVATVFHNTGEPIVEAPFGMEEKAHKVIIV